MKFFASKLVLLLSITIAMRTWNAEAAAICGNKRGSEAAAAATAAATDDSTTNEKSSNVNEKSETATSTAVLEATDKPLMPTTEFSEVKQFFRAVQCSLEKAEPFVEELEKEVKNLRKTALRFGETLVGSVGELLDKLFVRHDVGSFGVAVGVGGIDRVTTKPADDSEIATVELVEKVEKVTKGTELANDKLSEPSNDAVGVASAGDDNLASNEISLHA